MVMREMVNGHMHISLPAADGVLVIATLFGMFPFLEKLLEKLFADGGDQGAKFKKALAGVGAHLKVDIVKRSDPAEGFEVVRKRRVVERSFAGLKRCRGLAKDWESLNRNALAFLRLASIRRMRRKLRNPT